MVDLGQFRSVWVGSWSDLGQLASVHGRLGPVHGSVWVSLGQFG